jgi:MFS family permease
MATETSSPGIWETFKESPLAVKTVLGGVFINKVGGFLNIFIVLFMTAQGYSAAQAAIAFGVYGGGNVVGVLIGGALADRLGPRGATMLSMGGSAVLIAALLYLPNYPLLIVAVAVVGAVSQVYRPASATLLSELTSEERQVMTFAMYRFGLNLGTTAAPLIGFGLYELGDQNFTLVFWGEAFVALAYAVLAYFALPAKKQKAVGEEDADEAPTGSYADLFKDRKYLVYLVGAFLNGVVYVQYLATLPLDVVASGVPIFWYTVAVAINGGAVILFELAVTKVSQKLPFKLVVGTCYAMIGVGVAVYALPLGPAVILIGTLLWTMGEIFGAPVVFAYPGMAGPNHLRGRYIGSFQFMYGLGAAVGPVVGGLLFVALGHAMWPVIAISGLLAAVCGSYAVANRPKGETAEVAAPVVADAEEVSDEVAAEPVESK